jgi:hypothetical protein
VRTSKPLRVVLCLLVLAALTGCASAGRPSSGSAQPVSGASKASSATASASPSAIARTEPQPAPELPRGGRTLFPRYRLVGYSGAPGSAAFGRLGIGNIDARGQEIEARGRALAGGRQPLPVFELITVVAQGSPGPHGTYSSMVDASVISSYLAAARRHHALLLLDLQPGRAHFLPLVKSLRRWLEQPDVGLALDPEWAVPAGEVPGQSYGHTTGAEIDSVAAYLDSLVRLKNLPQKALVFHQVAASVVSGQSAIRRRPGVEVIKSVDGIGDLAEKTDTWKVLVKGLPPSVHTGFKLFFSEDARHGRLMTPQQVLALRPQPEYVLYE